MKKESGGHILRTKVEPTTERWQKQKINKKKHTSQSSAAAVISVILSPEGASLSEPSTTTSGLTQHSLAVSTHHNRLGVTENGGYTEAALALDVHEEGVGRLHETLELMLPLLQLCRWLSEINIVAKRHFVVVCWLVEE